jgi:hypothetical protein
MGVGSVTNFKITPQLIVLYFCSIRNDGGEWTACAFY